MLRALIREVKGIPPKRSQSLEKDKFQEKKLDPIPGTVPWEDWDPAWKKVQEEWWNF